LSTDRPALPPHGLRVELPNGAADGAC